MLFCKLNPGLVSLLWQSRKNCDRQGRRTEVRSQQRGVLVRGRSPCSPPCHCGEGDKDAPRSSVGSRAVCGAWAPCPSLRAALPFHSGPREGAAAPAGRPRCGALPHRPRKGHTDGPPQLCSSAPPGAVSLNALGLVTISYFTFTLHRMVCL